MNRPFTVVAVFIFAIVCAIQLARLFLGWVVVIEAVAIPMWASAVAAAVAAAMAVLLWRESRR
jgi:Na+/H+ antiporter NhaB